MRRRGAIALGALALALAGGAGLSLAQDQNQVSNALGPEESAPPLPSPGPAENTTGASPVTEAPAELTLPPAPAAAPQAPAKAATNTVANAVADVGPPPPPKRPRYPVVVLQALDKATAETLRFEAKVGEPIRYKDLVIVPHACETQATDEPYAQTAAHLEVQFQPESQPIGGQQVAREVFRGWMFGDAPGLHAFEHPTYDLWVIACKASAPAPPAPPAPAVVPGAHL